MWTGVRTEALGMAAAMPTDYRLAGAMPLTR